MTKKIKRREFMRTGAVAGITLASAKSAISQFPTILIQSAIKPIVIASANGNRFKNGGDMTAVHKAFTMITGGSDVLDAVIAGVNIVELDPLDDSVGYGGLPNAEGIVQLDSSCMHGPKKRAGAVAAIEGVRTPSLVAKAVLDYTDHFVPRHLRKLAQALSDCGRRRAPHLSRQILGNHHLRLKSVDFTPRHFASCNQCCPGRLQQTGRDMLVKPQRRYRVLCIDLVLSEDLIPARVEAFHGHFAHEPRRLHALNRRELIENSVLHSRDSFRLGHQ